MVEEEAVRGDFMLRWAAVGLAVLMGFTQINDTKPLVLIRSGDYMRAHGLLPPRTDVLSLTMAEKPAPNVSWLFDHVVSLRWAIGWRKSTDSAESGDGGIRRIPAHAHVDSRSTDMVEFDLRRVCDRGMFIRFRAVARTGHNAGHDTHNAMALSASAWDIDSGLHWKLPLLIAIWCNFDSRAWVGAFVVVLYFMGVLVSSQDCGKEV